MTIFPNPFTSTLKSSLPHFLENFTWVSLNNVQKLTITFNKVVQQSMSDMVHSSMILYCRLSAQCASENKKPSYC